LHCCAARISASRRRSLRRLAAQRAGFSALAACRQQLRAENNGGAPAAAAQENRAAAFLRAAARYLFSALEERRGGGATGDFGKTLSIARRRRAGGGIIAPRSGAASYHLKRLACFSPLALRQQGSHQRSSFNSKAGVPAIWKHLRYRAWHGASPRDICVGVRRWRPSISEVLRCLRGRSPRHHAGDRP